MARARGILLLCGALLLAACSPASKTAAPPPSGGSAPINQAPSSVEPKVVPQFAHGVPVVGVQWVDGGRVLVSLGGDGSLVFWDVASGHIIDHAQIPGYDPGFLLQDFRTAGDGKSLELIYYPDQEFGDGPPPPECKGASHAGGGWCTYRVDVMTREARGDPSIAVPAKVPDKSDVTEKTIFPLSPDGKLQPRPNIRNGETASFQNDDNFQFDDTDCVSRDRCRSGVSLFPVKGGSAIKLVGNPPSFFSDADISPDGRRLVRVDNLKNRTRTRVEAMDLTSATELTAYSEDVPHQQVSWVGESRFTLFSTGYTATNDFAAGKGFPAAAIVDSDCAKNGNCPTLPSYWQMLALDDAGSFVGTRSLQGCFDVNASMQVVVRSGSICPGEEGADDRSYLPNAKALAVHLAGKPGWQRLALAAWKDQAITALGVSPDRSLIAVATRQWTDVLDKQDERQMAVQFSRNRGTIIGPPRKGENGTDKPARQILRVWLVPIKAGTAGTPRQLTSIDYASTEMSAIVQGYFTDDGTIGSLQFTPDGQQLVFSQFRNTAEMIGEIYVVAVADGSVRKYPGVRGATMPIGNDRVLDLGTPMSGQMQLHSLATGKPVGTPMRQLFARRAGAIARSNLFWTAGEDGTIRFWDANDAALQLTLFMFPGNRFFAVTPGGRYDTNLGPDAPLVRWMVPDAPMQSLSPQTFMRDFYEPGLYGKLLDCREAANCASVFKALPAIASLNRVLPQVRIAEVKQGKDASEAIVTVDVAEGVDPQAANGKTHSGIFNPRLFRDGRVVAMTPDRVDMAGGSMADWQKANDVAHGAAKQRFTYTVPLPTSAGSEQQVFSAYAFNEDRIKSETATVSYTRPPVAPRAPQAYVVTIGIDDYDTPRFQLNYSVADARLIADRLATIPGHEVHRLTLAGERKPDGSRSRVDQATIGQVLSLLAGNGNRDTLLAALAKSGTDATMLRQATPDDLVIVSFSGHGWADPKGNFYLIPTNGRWPDGSETPDLATVFATAELTRYFQAMSAADITVIIDACHSAASVADGRFKPGPMGDAGLGQLAYDKGIRILAATQANDVAMEDARLKQGLLTYALAAEGLNATGGLADLDRDRRIRLDEWLRYAVQRMPKLAADTRVGQIDATGAGAARAIVFHDLPASAPKRRVQQPSLFDFNAATSPVVLRQLGR